MPAKQLTVRKESANKGRYFYKCGFVDRIAHLESKPSAQATGCLSTIFAEFQNAEGDSQDCDFFQWATGRASSPGKQTLSPASKQQPFAPQSRSSSATLSSQHSTQPQASHPRARYSSLDWDNAEDDDFLSQIPEAMLTPSKPRYRPPVIEDDDDPIQEEDTSSPRKKARLETFSTPAKPSPSMASTPSTTTATITPSPAKTVVDEVATPILAQLDDLPARIAAAATTELEAVRKEVLRMARLQVAKGKQLDFKQDQLDKAKVEIAMLRRKCTALEEENEALKNV
jgi:hypothetical protein